MNEIKSSWSFVEISPEAREAAERAASAAGMDLDAWLAQLIKYTSAMELKATPQAAGAEPGAQAIKRDPMPAPPARPLSTPLPAQTAVPPNLSIAPAAPPAPAPRADGETLLTGGRAGGPAAAPVTERSERPAPVAPPFSLPNPAPRPTVLMPQRPGGPTLGLSLRPATAEQLPHAAEATPTALRPAGQSAPPRPEAAPTSEDVTPDAARSEQARDAAGAPVGDLAPPPSAPEAPRMVPTDMLQPSRFAALASPKEDDIQAALDKWRASGMLEPLVARPKAGAQGQFEIISGIDRWHAARRAYVRQIPVLVHEASDQQSLEQGLVDQLRRAPVSPLAEANIYLRLLNDAGLDTDEAARLAGKPASHVATMVRILNLPKAVRAMLEKGEITVMHARALLDAPNPEAIARDIVEKRLDIYQTEQLVRVAGRGAEMVDASVLQDAPTDDSIAEMGTAPFAREPRAPGEQAARRQPPEAPAETPRAEEARPLAPTARRPSEARAARETDVISTELLERNIANALGVRCAISERNGVGVITVHYTSREELGRILARINGGGTSG
jgi:ParB/RepB/Spo0J family partition protein